MKNNSASIIDKDDEEYLKELYASLRYNNERFDKTVLLIASGILTVSFAFIKEILDKSISDTEYKLLLISGWISSAVVISLSLICSYLIIQAIRWTVENLNLERSEFDKRLKAKNNPIRIMHFLIILLILYSIVSIVFFIYSNLN